MHITASVFINDDEDRLHQDGERWLEGLAPHEPVSQYLHNRMGEDNGDAHLKRRVEPALPGTARQGRCVLRASAVQVRDARWSSR
jgi:hypothetical protein